MQDARRRFLVMHPHTGCEHQEPGGSPSQSTEVPYEEDALQLLLSHLSEKTLCTADALSYCHNPPHPGETLGLWEDKVEDRSESLCWLDFQVPPYYGKSTRGTRGPNSSRTKSRSSWCLTVLKGGLRNPTFPVLSSPIGRRKMNWMCSKGYWWKATALWSLVHAIRRAGQNTWSPPRHCKMHRVC